MGTFAACQMHVEQLAKRRGASRGNVNRCLQTKATTGSQFLLRRPTAIGGVEVHREAAGLRPIGFDFGRTPVHAGPNSTSAHSLSRLTPLHAQPFFQLRTAEQDAGDAGTVTQQPLPSGYGWTECKFPGGAKSTITTSGCNLPCTVAHEAVHQNDIKPCCDQANTEYFFADSAEKKDRVRATWKRWADSVRATTECRAYAVSIPCLNRALSEKKCGTDAMNPADKECCGEIRLAHDDDVAGSDKYCPSAAKNLPPCPFGPSGP